eukprot:8897602-Heterocapsa_arctica.AAC.1
MASAILAQAIPIGRVGLRPSAARCGLLAWQAVSAGLLGFPGARASGASYRRDSLRCGDARAQKVAAPQADPQPAFGLVGIATACCRSQDFVLVAKHSSGLGLRSHPVRAVSLTPQGVDSRGRRRSPSLHAALRGGRVLGCVGSGGVVAGAERRLLC